GADLRADPIFERSDDLAARGVILRVGTKDESDIEREPDRVALNLDVAFLHDVEEANLDFAGEIGKFIDCKNPAIRSWQKSVVHGQLAAEFVTATSRLDGVDVADQVSDGDVRSRQLFDITLLRREIRHGRIVA